MYRRMIILQALAYYYMYIMLYTYSTNPSALRPLKYLASLLYRCMVILHTLENYYMYIMLHSFVLMHDCTITCI